MIKEANMGKFASEEVYMLFNELNKLEPMRKYRSIYGSDLEPTKIDQFKNKSLVSSRVTDTNFNAYGCFEIGNNYEQWGQKNAEPIDYNERAKECADEILSAINNYFEHSTDPKYSQLEGKIVNKDIHYIRLHSKDNDDGQEYYGVQLFLKISYK